MFDVTIRSSVPSRAGFIGLDLRSKGCFGQDKEGGPASFINVTIVGFDYGVWFSNFSTGYTFEDLTLKNQRTFGFHNQSNSAVIRKLYSENSAPAVNEDISGTSCYGGLITIIDSKLVGLTGASSEYAIRSKGNGSNKAGSSPATLRPRATSQP